MIKLTVTLLASSTDQGNDLALMLQAFFEQEHFDGSGFTLNIVFNGTQTDLMLAGLQDDLVIFDASIEDEIGSNYQVYQMWPSTMDHFLVVSRTRLPLNFQPYHLGGTPDTAGTLTARPDELSNAEIVKWIKQMLGKMRPHLPRPETDKLVLAKNEFFARRKELFPLMERLIFSASERKKHEQKSNGRAFVSYLSRYSKYHYASALLEPTVEHLIEYRKKQLKNEYYPVLYYPPGALSGEFMTEHRRWQVLAVIDRRIRSADECWIFETEDYYNSWWTLAELAALAYIRHYDPDAMPKIMLCTPTSDGFHIREAAPDYIQTWTEEAAREFGRRLSKSDPLTGGYETVKLQRWMSKQNRIVQWLTFQSGQLISRLLMSSSPNYQQMQEEKKKNPGLGTFKHYRNMLNSPVYREGFWQDRIVTCPCCTQKNEAKNHFDLDSFLFNQLPGQYRVSSEQMNQITNTGVWQCEICSYKYQVVLHKYPQYLLWPLRMGKPTGPNGCFIERVPMFELRPLS